MKPSNLARNLALFALLNAAAVNALLILGGTPFKQTTLAYTADFLRFHAGDDSWLPIFEAYRYAAGDHSKPVYDAVFFDRKFKFQYPVTSLFIASGLSKAFPDILRAPDGYARFVRAANACSWALLAVMAWFVWKIFEQSSVQNGLAAGPWARVPVLILALTFYPAVKAFSLGQAQVWINTALTLAVWFWIRGKKQAAALFVAAACVIKPQFGLVFVWAWLRGQRKFFWTGTAAIAACYAVSVARFGLADHGNYLKMLSFISQRGEAYYPNQCVNGLLHRLLFSGDNLLFDDHAYPPYNAWVYAGTLVSSILMIGAALFWPTAEDRKGGTADFFVMLMTSVMSSPVAWQHHYGMLLPIDAALLPYLLRRKPFGAATLPSLAASYMLTSNYFAVTKRFARVSGWNLIQSYIFFGALILLAGLYALRGRSSRPKSAAAASGIFGIGQIWRSISTIFRPVSVSPKGSPSRSRR